MSLQNAVVHNILNFNVLEPIVGVSVVTRFSGTTGVSKTVKNCFLGRYGDENVLLLGKLKKLRGLN